MRRKTAKVERFAIVADGGWVWNQYDRWVRWHEVNSPAFYRREADAKYNLGRAKVYAGAEEGVDENAVNPESVRVERITLIVPA